MFRLLISAVVACACSTGLAQNRVLPSTFSLGSWMFKPIVDTAATGHQINDIVAIAAPGTTANANIVAVWYHRPATDQGSWEAKTWATTSVAEAIKAIKVTLGLPDSDDELWPNAGVVEIQTASGLSELRDYDKGFMSDDPLHAVVSSSPDRDSIVEFLKNIGWPVANMTFETATGANACLKDHVLYGMAAAGEVLVGVDVEYSVNALDQSSPLNAAFVAFQGELAARCQINIPIPWDVPDFSPRIILPPRWFPTEPGGNWLCWDRGDTCWECQRTREGRWCKTMARIRNDVLQIITCCCDSAETQTKVCCGVSGPQQVPNCPNPIIDNRHYSPSFGFCNYDNPPCIFAD